MNKEETELSKSQKEAILWVRKNDGRFFWPFNCYLKRQTINALVRKKMLAQCKDNRQYMQITKLGKNITIKP